MDSHIDRDNDALHGSSFALGDSIHTIDTSDQSSKEVKCIGCLAPFAVLDKLGSFLLASREDAVQMLRDVRIKFQQYYGHLHRVKAQQLAIERMSEESLKKKLFNRVVMLADYTMKYEPIRYREKTLDFFGKKGISWHGIVVFYLDRVEDDSWKYVGPEHLSMLFYDHVVQNDSQQDVSAVASIIEAGMMRLRVDLPNVNEVVILSDNAGCYQNSTLPMMLPFVAKANNLTLLKFTHTETQDGKSLVDAHFAIAMRHVSKIVAEGRDVNTRSSIVEALNAGGEMKNIKADLVRIDRVNANLVGWDALRGTDNNGLAWTGRNKEYLYEGWSSNHDKVSVTVFRYSIHGLGRRCQFSRDGACEPLPKKLLFSWDNVISRLLPTSVSEGTPTVLREKYGTETGVNVLSQPATVRILSRRVQVQELEARDFSQLHSNRTWEIEVSFVRLLIILMLIPLSFARTVREGLLLKQA